MYATIVATHVEYFSIHQYSRNYVPNDKLCLITAVQILHVV